VNRDSTPNSSFVFFESFVVKDCGSLGALGGSIFVLDSLGVLAVGSGKRRARFRVEYRPLRAGTP
jgi:hypothetical protein